MRHLIVSLVALVLATAAVAETVPRHSVDHIVVGVSKLQFGMSQLKALTGVDPVFGGVHPHLGTHNALISLGDETYLEILAPNPDADPATVNATGQGYLAAISPLRQITPVLWAIGSTNLAQTRALLGEAGIELSTPVPGSRRKPDGSLLRWQTAEVTSFSSSATPFFIEWEGDSNPAASTPKGCTLSRLTLAADTPLRAMLTALELPVDIAGAGEAPLSVELSCPTGLVRLP